MSMDDETLERIFGPVRHLRAESGPVELSDGYRKLLALVDALPENQSGVDKSWVEKALREYRRYHSLVRAAR